MREWHLCLGGSFGSVETWGTAVGGLGFKVCDSSGRHGVQGVWTFTNRHGSIRSQSTGVVLIMW